MLARELHLGVLDDPLGLGREPDDQRRPLGFAAGDRSQNVRVLG